MLPKQLMFTVGLIDQITKPIAKISKQFNGLSSNYQAGTMKAASGMAGMAAAGYALTNAMQPAIDMDRALGEVKSLGVRDSALKELTNTAYDFSLKYGKSATEFISSSYDIQSAISGLNDADLSAFTLSSNVLATATKSDAATITNYMGTMFGIFKNQANSMGKSNWVEQVTGMTASAVQMFKTNGSEMSAAFTSIGAEGQSAGIGMNEQMAVLGTLQATMSGSEAGTKYKAFLAGVGKAQKSLGLEFTNSQGKMLPMVDILTKIKGKYGETLDVAESDALGKAFGSKEAAATVKLLMNDIDTLGGSIGALGKVKGMEQAEKMAAAMTDQSDRLSQSWFVIRAAFGTAILPVFNSFASWLANVGRDLVSFTEKYPTLTKYIGYAAVSLLGLVAAGGLFTLMMGAGQMAMVAWGVAGMVWAGITTVLTSGLTFLRGAMLAVNIAMYANPIGLIVAGIAAAVIAVGALIYYWDDLKATMGEWGWIKAITGVFSSMWDGIKSMFTSSLNWIIETINLIPGVDIDITPVVSPVNNDQIMPDVLAKNVMPLSPLVQTVPEVLPKNVMPLAPLAQTVPEVLPKNVVSLAPLAQTVPEVLPKNVVPLAPLAQTMPDVLPKNVMPLAPLTQTVPEILPKNVMPLAPLAQTVPEVLPKNVMPLAPLAQTVPEVLPKNVMPLAPLAQTVPQPLQKQNTPVASIQAIAPIKSRVENGGITQQISNANQKKSTSIGNVTIYPAKGETNFMNLVEMHG
jgi:TP901 family phage tail tape measure protein